MPSGYPVQQVAAQAAPVPQRPPVPEPPVANPYGSYVTAPHPTYPEAVAAHPDNLGYNGYGIGQPAAYGSPANGYLPAPGHNGGLSNGNGGALNGLGHANGNGHNGNGHNGYAGDYQTSAYQAPVYPAGQAIQPGYGQQGHVNGQYDPRDYGPSDVPYGQDGYQGYPGYGGGSR